jgi:hypothetical protein
MGSLGAAPGIILYASDAAGTAIFSFNDYLAATRPTLTSPEDNYSDAVNPSGGNGYPFDLKIKPLGTGAGQVDQVQIEIADKANGLVGTATVLSGATLGGTGMAVSPANPFVTLGTAAGAGAFSFQPNKSYLVRVRATHAASGQYLDSPWSEARTVNIQSGSIVSQNYAGPQLLGPPGGAQGLDPASIGFAWAPVSGATEYQIIVATDAAMTKTVAGTPANVTIPAYQAIGLSNSTVYYWAVMATKPAASVQTVGTFTTMAKPAPTPTTTVGGGTGGQPTIIVPAPPAETPAYIWAVIAIGTILVIAVIILIVRTKRTT